MICCDKYAEEERKMGWKDGEACGEGGRHMLFMDQELYKSNNVSTRKTSQSVSTFHATRVLKDLFNASRHSAITNHGLLSSPGSYPLPCTASLQ